MKFTCPKCSRQFRSGFGSHAPKCGLTDIDLFWAKVRKTDTCWVWIGARQRDGYAHFRSRAGKTITASRFSYEMANGQIPAGLDIMHTCDNPACVNPGHLRAATTMENIHDARDKRRHVHGDRQPRRKLNAAQAREILALKGTVRAEDLAASGRYPVGKGTIQAIWYRRLWKYIEEQPNV